MSDIWVNNRNFEFLPLGISSNKAVIPEHLIFLLLSDPFSPCVYFMLLILAVSL